MAAHESQILNSEGEFHGEVCHALCQGKTSTALKYYASHRRFGSTPGGFNINAEEFTFFCSMSL